MEPYCATMTRWKWTRGNTACSLSCLKTAVFELYPISAKLLKQDRLSVSWKKNLLKHYLNFQLHFFSLHPVMIISMICLLLTISVYLLVQKLRDLIGKCFICYMGCLFMGYLFLLFDLWDLSKGFCMTAGEQMAIVWPGSNWIVTSIFYIFIRFSRLLFRHFRVLVAECH